MGEKMETDIVSQLRQLCLENKSTLSENFKDFNLFVDSKDAEISRDITEILESFNPVVNVGKHFKVRLIDRYRVSAYALKLLQSDDGLYVSQVLKKCSWFFEDIEDAANFVDNIIPTLSFVTRLNVIDKYALNLKNTQAGNVVYRDIKARYGVKLALPLLAACSENFIGSELPNLNVALPPNTTLALYEKFPLLTTDYIRYLADDTIRKSVRCDLRKYKSTFIKLSEKELQSFLDLFESGISIPYLALGRRPTKKLLKNDTDKVVGSYKRYSGILKKRTFFTRLSLEQFKTLFVSSLFPNKLSEFCCGLWEAINILNYVKPNHRSHLILTAFKEKYNIDMTSDEVLFKLNEMWIAYIPEDARHRWLENKIAEATDVNIQAKFLAKLPVGNCMPRLKKLIESQCDPSVRAAVVKHLVRTIRINQHSAGIKDLFTYLVRRFRNETGWFHKVIVNEMSRFDKEMYLELGLRDWTPINDFINIIKLNKTDNYYYYTRHSLRGIFCYQVQSAFARKADVDLVLNNYIEYEGGNATYMPTDVIGLCKRETPCCRLYLEWLTRKTIEMEWADLSSKLEFIVDLFDAQCEYNKDRTDVMEIPDCILDTIESELLNGKQYARRHQILKAASKYQIPRLEKYIVKKVFPKLMNEDLVCHLLRHEPETILLHVHEVVRKTLKSEKFRAYTKFFKKCRMYHSFGIPSEMVNQCRKALESDSEVQVVERTWQGTLLTPVVQANAVRVLALLLQPSDYMDLVTQYIPDQKKIEQYSDEIRIVYEVQQAVCKSFIDVTAPFEMLPLIRKFAVGDFLKHVASSFVSTCLKVPESKILPLLEEWIDCPVSLRKHIIRLIYIIAPTNYGVEKFVDTFRVEKKHFPSTDIV